MQFRKPYNGNLRITSEFGNRRFRLNDGSWYSDFHNGIDIGGVFDVLAAASGVVVATATNGIDRGGRLVRGTPANFVIIDHGNGYRTLYWHLKSLNVRNGQRVNQGQKIGVSGRTGVATGYHLHFMIQLNEVNKNPRGYVNFSGNNSNLPIKPDANMEYITVQSGWGLSNVAIAAGLPATTATYETIYKLNAGHRGSTNWQSLNARMGPGDRLRVRVVESKPTPKPVADSKEVQKLEKQIAELKEAKSKSEAEAKAKYEELVLKSNKLAAEKESEILKLREEKEQQKTTLIAELEEVNNEIAELEASSITVPDVTPATHIAFSAITEEVKARGVIGKWHSFVDRNFKSSFMRGLLKYNWFWIVFIVIAYATNALEAIDLSTQNELIGTLITGAIGAGGYILMYLTTHYDKNKDGVIDFNDTSLGKIEGYASTTPENSK